MKGYSAPAVLLIGVLIIPVALSFAFNSWSAPDDAAYVRMAFANVAGATIAILTVLGLLLDRIIRRASLSTIAIFAVITLIVVPWQLSAVSTSGDLLLLRLSLGS